MCLVTGSDCVFLPPPCLPSIILKLSPPKHLAVLVLHTFDANFAAKFLFFLSVVNYFHLQRADLSFMCVQQIILCMFFTHMFVFMLICVFLFFFICFLFCKFSICKVCECVSNKHVWLRICDKLPIHNDFANVVMKQSVCHTAFRYTP